MLELEAESAPTDSLRITDVAEEAIDQTMSGSSVHGSALFSHPWWPIPLMTIRLLSIAKKKLRPRSGCSCS